MTDVSSSGSLEPGTVHTRQIIRNLTRSRIVQYAGASGDLNPIHSDEVYATQAVGLPSVFGHGMLTMGATGGFLQELVGAGSLQMFRVRFVERVWPGDTLVATAVVVESTAEDEGRAVALDVLVSNQANVTVLKGSARALVPDQRLHRPASNLEEPSHA